MSIPQRKYVDITSAAAKTAAAKYKELIARVFTTNDLFPVGHILEFTSSADVANFAGSLSTEAKIASEYFGWVSKRAKKPQKISFMRYSLTALAPYLYSVKALPSIAQLKAITDGSMVVELGGTSYTLSSIDLSSITAYVDVATALQTAIRANTSGGAIYTSATVEYVAARNSFKITGGTTGNEQIGYTHSSGSGTDLSTLLGLDGASGAIISDGQTAKSITDILNNSIELSSNFLTFGFVNAADAVSNLDEIGAFCDEQNFQYRFCFDLGRSNLDDKAAAAQNHKGMTAHFNINYGVSGLVPAWLMSAILPATTDYNKANAVKNYMFQEFPNQPVSVGENDGTFYQHLDELNVNYNGQTQKSGQKLAFYQNGFNADGTDSAVFDNEAWLKDYIATDILNAFLGLDFISADDDGKAVIAGILDNNADIAFKNHVFARGKELTEADKAYITQLFDDDTAYLDVQNKGYKYIIDIVPQNSGNATIYVAEYTLVYLKNDVVRKVTGSNILI